MSSLKDRISPADPTNDQLRVTLFIGLGLLHISAEILSTLPDAETALEAGHPERFRLLFAGEAARCWLVGHGAADSTERPGEDSAFAGALRALDWTAEELERHYSASLADWADFREDR
jgi:hypothetical protein